MRRRRNTFGSHKEVLRRRLKWGVAICTIVTGLWAFGTTNHHAGHRSPPAYTNIPADPVTPPPSAPTTSGGLVYPWNHGRRTLLLIGTDARPGDQSGNADVLMLCSLDNLHHRIELLSIPRDTKVVFDNGRFGKINAILQRGGPERAMATVSELLDVPIDNYVLVHFPGVVQLVNALGGVTVRVPERMYTRTGDKQYGYINLYPGEQRLNGVQALGFVRYRHDELGDIGRTKRQQQFMHALLSEATRGKNLLRLPSTVHHIYDTVDTNVSLLDSLRLAGAAKAFASNSIVSGTLPGSFHDPNPELHGDASYWIVNGRQAAAVTHNLLEHGIAVSNPVQPLSVTVHWHEATATNNHDMDRAHTDRSKPNSVKIPDSRAKAQDRPY